MSPRLAIAAALSVLLMAAYVLLGQQSTRVPLAGEPGFNPVIHAPTLSAPSLGPLFRQR